VNQTIVNGIQTVMLEALVDTGAVLDGATLCLFQNDISPTANTVIGDITACDYSGYAAEAITWLDPSISEDGHIEMIGIAGEFRPTASTTPNNVYGAYILGSGGALFAAGRLDDAPEYMGATTNSMLLTVRVRLSPFGVPTVEIT